MIYILHKYGDIASIVSVQDDGKVEWLVDNGDFESSLASLLIDDEVDHKEAVKFDTNNLEHWRRLPDIFRSPYYFVEALTDEEFMDIEPPSLESMDDLEDEDDMDELELDDEDFDEANEPSTTD